VRGLLLCLDLGLDEVLKLHLCLALLFNFRNIEGKFPQIIIDTHFIWKFLLFLPVRNLDVGVVQILIVLFIELVVFSFIVFIEHFNHFGHLLFRTGFLLSVADVLRLE